MAKSRGRKFAELVAPTNGVFAAASIPTITLSKLSASTFSVNSESASLGGNVVLDSNDITEHTNAKYFTNARAQATLSVAANSGHGALAYDNSNGQFTFAGITTEAIQDVVGAQLATNGSHTGVSISYDDAGDGAIDLTVNDTTKVPLAGGTMTGNLTLGDNVKAYFGASTDLQIYHDTANSHIINSTGELRFSGSDFAIKSDSAKLLLGADDDLQIYYDGNHSYMTNTGGSLYIRSTNSIQLETNGGVDMLTLGVGGAATLYHNGSAKLATTSTGVAITGLATMATGTASSKFAVGTATVHGSYAFYNNSNSYFNGAVTVDDTLSANKLVSLDGVLELDDNGTHNGIINSPASLRVNIDSDNGGTGESFAVGHNQTAINANNKLFEVNDSGQVTINNAFTFPNIDGSANQILQTNGSGVVSWVTNTGGTSIWSQSGSNIYYTSGNVGIGISSPSTKLDIKTANIGSSSNFAAKAISVRLPFVSGYNNVIASGLGFYDNTIHSTDIGLAYNRNSTGGYDLVFSTNPTTSGSPVERMTINADGLVGIGTSNPGRLLDVGASGAGGIVGIKGGNYNQVNIAHSSNSSWGMLLTNSDSTSNSSYHKSTSGENNSVALVNVNNDAVHFGTNNTHRMTIDHDGYVGIGTSDPASLLHIATSNDEKIILSGANDPYIRWQEGTTNKAYIQWNAAGYLQIGNQEDNSSIKIDSGLTVIPASDQAIVLQGRNDPYIRWQEQTTDKAYIQWNAAGYLQIGNQEDNSSIRLKDALDFTTDGSTYHSIWHAGNDGTGSGLDADTLDGLQSDIYFKSYTNNNGGWSQSNRNFSVRTGGNAVGLHMEESDGTFGFQLYGDGSNYGFLDGEWNSWDLKKVTNGELYVDAGSGLQKVWHAGNDGSGSGLDADTLDGVQGSIYLKSNVANTIGNNLTSTAASTSGLLGAAYSTSYFGLKTSAQTLSSEYMIISAGTDTYISATSGYSVYIRHGANNSTNQLIVGSGATGLSWRGNTVWTAENDGSGSGLDADLLDGVQLGSIARTDLHETFTSSITVNGNIYTGDGNDGYFFNDTGGRTAFAGGDFYIQNSVGNYYNYATNQYIGDSSGDNIYFRSNVLSGTGWGINGAGKLTTRDHQINAGYHLQRSDHHSGHLEGSYNNVGPNSTKTNPIYTIGSSYNPLSTGLSNMYGIGYSHPDASFISFTGASGWGMYVAADGDARVWLDGSAGVISSTGHHYVGSNVVWNAGNDGSGSGLDADTVDGLHVHNTTGTQNSANQIVRTQSNGYTMLGWINTTSGDSGLANDITRIYCSNDSYIRYLGKADFKVLIGNSGQTTYDRRDYTSNALYHTGANSHNDITYNQLFERGCGFNDNWNSGTGRPPGSHSNGFTATHYASGSSYFHGMQMAMNAGNPSTTYLRGWWANGGSGYAWQKIWTDGNDGSGSGLDADLLDGLNAKGVGSATGASQVLTSNTNNYFVHQSWIDVGTGGIYSATNNAHFYPNTQTSYCTWRTAGSRAGYDGILFDSGGDVAIMFDSGGNGGFYRQATGRWYNYHHLGNNCTGFSTSTTSSSYVIYAGGGIYATGNIVAYSDRRIKENIVPIDNALEKVNKLAGVYYNKIGDEKKTREIGFIAQDVNEVTPELVTYAEDVDQYGVKYGNTTALLVEAVKELTQQVNDLKQELEELKNG